MPSDWTVKLSWKQYLVCTSTNNAQIMSAVGFELHDDLPGTLRPPRRFKDLPNGKKSICFNPCERSPRASMTCSMLRRLQTELRDFYHIDIGNFTFERKPQWEHPADAANPVPIEDPDCVLKVVDRNRDPTGAGGSEAKQKHFETIRLFNEGKVVKGTRRTIRAHEASHRLSADEDEDEMADIQHRLTTARRSVEVMGSLALLS
ncbi:hypothetical protein C8T65DRAFT_696372 [Cerioporus squamosus]|nr:hypothetical protein C8T65DRAFT_696372 [Cerioporus squamosus]